MTKFCPFMSKDPSIPDKSSTDKNMIPCMDTCALYWKGFCSINILAQKAVHDSEKEKKEKSVSE